MNKYPPARGEKKIILIWNQIKLYRFQQGLFTAQFHINIYINKSVFLLHYVTLKENHYFYSPLTLNSILV